MWVIGIYYSVGETGWQWQSTTRTSGSPVPRSLGSSVQWLRLWQRRSESGLLHDGLRVSDHFTEFFLRAVAARELPGYVIKLSHILTAGRCAVRRWLCVSFCPTPVFYENGWRHHKTHKAVSRPNSLIIPVLTPSSVTQFQGNPLNASVKYSGWEDLRYDPCQFRWPWLTWIGQWSNFVQEISVITTLVPFDLQRPYSATYGNTNGDQSRLASQGRVPSASQFWEYL